MSTKASHYYHLAFSILLGASSASSSSLARVIGGTDAQEHAYPYQASLRVVGHHKCGGSILNDHWILTAAHCLVKYEATTITVVLGSNHLVYGGVAYRVALGHVHPGYSKAEHIGDIGLLMINGVIQFSEDTQPISLPSRDDEDSFITGRFTGWGNAYLNGANNDELQVILLDVIQLASCQKTFPKVGPGHLCTLNKAGEGICYGDSGSPLVADGVQIGIASWGSPCAQGYPDVHTRVYYYLDWITSIIASSKTCRE